VPAGSADELRYHFETVHRTLSSHPCHDIAQVYGLLLKGLTWAEVTERLHANEATSR
jgi:hypothetical protein